MQINIFQSLTVEEYSVQKKKPQFQSESRGITSAFCGQVRNSTVTTIILFLVSGSPCR